MSFIEFFEKQKVINEYCDKPTQGYSSTPITNDCSNRCIPADCKCQCNCNGKCK